MRRSLAVALACVVVAATGCDRLVDRQIERGLRHTRTDLLTSPDLHVVLCGTGSPLADPRRASACTAIVAGGELLLVDAGPGSWEVTDTAGLPGAGLSGVQVTLGEDGDEFVLTPKG